MTTRVKSSKRSEHAPFTTYDQEETFIRIGNPYARDLLLASGWKLDKDGFLLDPVKKTMTRDLEGAFFTQLVREISAKKTA